MGGGKNKVCLTEGAVGARLTPLLSMTTFNALTKLRVIGPFPFLCHTPMRARRVLLVAGAGEGPRFKLLRRSRIRLRNCCEAVVATITRCYVAQFLLLRARPPETRTILNLMWLLISIDVLVVT